MLRSLSWVNLYCISQLNPYLSYRLNVLFSHPTHKHMVLWYCKCFFVGIFVCESCSSCWYFLFICNHSSLISVLFICCLQSLCCFLHICVTMNGFIQADNYIYMQQCHWWNKYLKNEDYHCWLWSALCILEFSFYQNLHVILDFQNSCWILLGYFCWSHLIWSPEHSNFKFCLIFYCFISFGRSESRYLVVEVLLDIFCWSSFGYI